MVRWLTKEDARPLYYKNRVNAGLHVMNTRIFDTAGINADAVGRKGPDGKLIKVDLDRQLLKPLAGRNLLFVYDSPEYVKDMGTPAGKAAGCRTVLVGRKKGESDGGGDDYGQDAKAGNLLDAVEFISGQCIRNCRK